MISAQNVTAENWVEYAELETMGAIFYIETETVKKHDDFVYYWTMVDYLEPDKFGGLSAKSYEKVDCDSERYQRLTYVFYKENIGKGTPEYSDSYNKEWRHIIPGSINSFALDFACSYID